MPDDERRFRMGERVTGDDEDRSRAGESDLPAGERPGFGANGLRIVVLFAVVAAVFAGVYLWLSRPRPQPVAASVAGPTLTSAKSSKPTSGPASPQGSTVVVHVHGKVRHPGVVTLSSGSRVADAIKAAGGPRPGAGTGSLNLARKVVDGEQIPVGVRAAVPAAPPPSPGGSAPAGSAPGAPLDLNTATVDQLDDLPGVGPVLAQRIVDYRTQHGGFRSVEQLQEVSGIGAKRFADLKSMVRA